MESPPQPSNNGPSASTKKEETLPVPKGGSAPAPRPALGKRPAARPIHRRPAVWVLGFMIILGVALWMGRGRIAARVEASLLRQLHEQGIYPRYVRRSWLPWRGLRFDNVALNEDAAGLHPVIELSTVNIRIHWLEFLRGGGVVSRWRTKDAMLTLHDSSGAVAFEHVSADVLVDARQIDFRKLDFRHDPMAWSLTGKILLGPMKPPTPGNFYLDLSGVRGTLGSLDFKPGLAPFFVHGNVFINLRAAPVVWQASLSGSGKTGEWHGIPFRDAEAKAGLSAEGMKLESSLQLTKGSVKFTGLFKDWMGSPFFMDGQFSDGGHRSDAWQGNFDGGSQTLTIAKIKGTANLLEFMRNFPMLIPYLPTGISLRRFPDVAVKDFLLGSGKTFPVWSVGSVEVLTPADITIKMGDQPLTIDGMKGRGSYKADTWQAKVTTGAVSWRGLSVREAQVDGELDSADLKLSSMLSLTKGSLDLTVSTERKKGAPCVFTGSLADSAGRADHIAGRYDGASDTAVVSQLNGNANLIEFSSNFPALAARLPEGWQIRRFPDLAVKDLSFGMGGAVADWKVGSLQLRSSADITMGVSGHSLEVDSLTGQAGFDGKAWRLSGVAGQTLGGRFEVDGLYESGVLRSSTLAIKNFRMKELSPWFTEAQASIGEALFSMDYRGAIGSKASLLTGSGKVHMENAPLVKVPLLDETYTLFSALGGVKRTGAGSLDASFSATRGVLAISHFSAQGDAVAVTATGKIDLIQQEISGRAKANLRGVAGLVTRSLGGTLEMQVSGSLGRVRVQPIGPVGGAGKGIAGAAKATGNVLQEGVSAPAKIFEWFKKEATKANP